MPKIVPFLNFAGQAAQAMALYEKAFTAKIKVKLTYADMNPADAINEVKEEHKNFIGYSEIEIRGETISLYDDSNAAENPIPISGNTCVIALLVHFDSDEELKKAYEILSDGGTIITPLFTQTYCSLAADLIDKFGGRWSLMSGYKG
ncbi:MAG: VOC family protein [Oscillospiraceae bacterium]|jgi:PhnB protein|nr:VOC family protein [Oscillospiraceae bacterium]